MGRSPGHAAAGSDLSVLKPKMQFPGSPLTKGCVFLVEIVTHRLNVPTVSGSSLGEISYVSRVGWQPDI